MAKNIKPKYRVDESKRKRFPPPLFITTVKHEVNEVEVEKFLKRNGRLPDHVYRVKESENDGKA